MRISDWSSDVCSSDLGATTGTPPSNPESPILNPGLMRYDAEPAYVLHARAWRETSLLLELLTEHHGRIGLVARGVQGPKKHVLREALQPLPHIRLYGVQRGALAHLPPPEATDQATRLPGE